MEKFKAEIFYRLAKILERMRIHYALELPVGDAAFSFTSSANLPITAEQQLELTQLCVSVVTLCGQIGLRQSVKCAEALWNELATEVPGGSAVLKPAPTRLHVSYSVRELDHSIDREIEDNIFMYVPVAEAEYYDKPALFGGEVKSAFPKAAADIREAGNCYAAGRSTACVFHLMRAIEVGLRALGASLKNSELDPKQNPTWERILRPCDEELRRPIAQRSPEWRQDEAFFSNATANLRAVKDAWRNPSLHVERDYDQAQAHEILNAVRGFMRHLATKISDD